MFSKIKEWFFGPHTATTTKPEAAPYKVETPAPVGGTENRVEAPAPVSAPEPKKCGCGRSPSGLCVGLHALTAEDWAVHKDNPNRAKPAAKKPKAAPKARITAKPKSDKPAAKPRPKKSK